MTDEEVMNSLLAKIYAVIGEDDPINQIRGGDTYVSFTRPGVPVGDKEFEFGLVATSLEEADYAVDFADFANIIPSTNGFWNPTGRRVNTEYFKCIDQPVLPVYELSQEEKSRLEAAKSVLHRKIQTLDRDTGELIEVMADTPLYRRYLELRVAYQDALTKYNTEFANYISRRGSDSTAEMIWIQVEPTLSAAVRHSYNDWVAAGKEQVETAIATRENLERRGAENLSQSRREIFRDLTKRASGEPYQYTKFFPDNFWKNPGWTKVSFRHDEVHTVDTSKIEKWGGSSGASFGLWSYGASASGQSENTYHKADTSNFSVEFSLAKVVLRRTWMDAGVFSSRAWTLPSNVYTQADYLSDGARDPDGTMVAYPTAIIMARDVKLNFLTNSTENSYSMREITAKAKGGWGPFSVKGNYYKKTTRKTHDFVETANGIEVPGMQVIGFVLERLPKCPYPDPELNWPEGVEIG